MSFTPQPVRIADDVVEEGTLVFHGEPRLVVLTRLSQHHDDVAGRWFLEVGFGRLDGLNYPTFPDMKSAGEQWPDERLRQVCEE